MRNTGGKNVGDNWRRIPSALQGPLETVSRTFSDYINQTLVKDLVVSFHNKSKERVAHLLKILYSKVRSSILSGFGFLPWEIAKHMYQLKNGIKKALNFFQFSFNILSVYSLLPEF